MLNRLLAFVAVFSFTFSSAEQRLFVNDFFTTIYDRDMHISLFLNYMLPSNINDGNLKKRPSKYTSSTDNAKKIEVCYKYSGYDRGHLAPDAFFDSSLSNLKEIYVYENIVPETPHFNRSVVFKVENYIKKNYQKIKNISIQVVPSNKRLKNDPDCPVIPKKLIYIIKFKDGTIKIMEIENK